MQNHTESNDCAKIWEMFGFKASNVIGLCQEQNSFNTGGKLGA